MEPAHEKGRAPPLRMSQMRYAWRGRVAGMSHGFAAEPGNHIGNLMKQLKALLLAAALASSAGAFARTPLPLHIGGRVAATMEGERSAYHYQWPGVYFEAAFEGSEVYVRVADDTNRLRILVDGRPNAVLDRPGTVEHRIGNLPEGRHTIRLEKLTESQDSTGTFEGFYIPALSKALPTDPRPRQIEFIGNSDMVGYGNTSASRECTDEELFLATDTQQAYGPLVADRFGADYQINAYSGIGVIRNYDGMRPELSMTTLYPRALFDAPVAYRNDGWAPQLIVVGLGGNDFVPAVKSGGRWKDQQALLKDFELAYAAFLRRLRGRNPDAFILLVVLETFDAGYVAGNRSAIRALRKDGDRRIDLLTYPQLENTGCHWHPSLKDHRVMADQVIAYIAARPELWQATSNDASR